MQDADFLLVHQMMLLDATLAEAVPNQAARQAVYQLVGRLLSDLHMEPLSDLEFYEATDVRAPGWSFIQPITTSHISGHYFELSGEPPHIHIDVYSCKPFDHMVTVRAIHGQFDLAEWVATLVKRDMDLTRRLTLELVGAGDQLTQQNDLSNRTLPQRQGQNVEVVR